MPARTRGSSRNSAGSPRTTERASRQNWPARSALICQATVPESRGAPASGSSRHSRHTTSPPKTAPTVQAVRPGRQKRGLQSRVPNELRSQTRSRAPARTGSSERPERLSSARQIFGILMPVRDWQAITALTSRNRRGQVADRARGQTWPCPRAGTPAAARPLPAPRQQLLSGGAAPRGTADPSRGHVGASSAVRRHGVRAWLRRCAPPRTAGGAGCRYGDKARRTCGAGPPQATIPLSAGSPPEPAAPPAHPRPSSPERLS